MIRKARIGSARKYHLSLSHLQQTCFLGLFCHFIAFLEFADCEQAPGAAAGFLEWELFVLMPLCLCRTSCVLFVQQRRQSVCKKSQGHWISCSCAEKENRGTVTALILFSLLSLRWWEVPPDRTTRGLVSLSLCCAKEPFAYLHRSFKKH